MKNLYVCEKCGKMFDNWDDAYKCEYAHQDVDGLYSFNLLIENGQPMPTQFWEEGAVAPSLIIMQHVKVDQNGDIIKKEMPNGRKVAEYIPVVYKRVHDKTLPNGLKLADYKAAMDAKKLQDNQPEEDAE